MAKQFVKAWLAALEKRIGVEAKIAQITLEDMPRMLVYYFQDIPAEGMLTAVTAGMETPEIRNLINPDHPLPDHDDGYPLADVIELVHRRKRDIIE